MKKLSLGLTVGLLILILGCATGTDGDGGYPRLSLGWAYEIAEGIRDTEFPDGELVVIIGVRLDGNGLIEEQVLLYDLDEPAWNFYFQDNDDSTGFWIIVYPDGSVASQGIYYFGYDTIPTYYDAAEWVHVADDLVSDYEEYDWDSTFRELRIACNYNGFECNCARIRYFVDELKVDTCQTPVAEIILNADTNEVLDWYIYW